MLRLVEHCDFVTNLGHRGVDGRSRKALGHRGRGPDHLVTELGLFDYDAEGHARLQACYPDVDAAEIAANTGFALRVADGFGVLPLPDAESIAIIRRLDPMRVHARELRPPDRERVFALT